MHQIFDHPNQRIWYDETQAFLKNQRLCKPDEFIWEEDYKAQMLDFLAIVLKYRPKRILMDLRQFFYPVSPQLQEWVRQEIVAQMLANGVQKGAFVLPPDVVPAASVEQIYDEEEVGQLPVRMFEDYARALKWLGVREEKD